MQKYYFFLSHQKWGHKKCRISRRDIFIILTKRYYTYY